MKKTTTRLGEEGIEEYAELTMSVEGVPRIAAVCPNRDFHQDFASRSDCLADRETWWFDCRLNALTGWAEWNMVPDLEG